MSGIVYQCKLRRFSDLVKEVKKSTPYRPWFETILEEANDVSQGLDLSPVIDDLTDTLLKCHVFALSRDTTNTKFLCFFSSIPEFLFKLRINSQLKTIKEELKSMREKAKSSSSAKTAPRQKVYGSLDTSWPADSSHIIGITETQKKLSEKLKSGSQTNADRFIAIAIVGTGGSGKTALAQMVLNSFGHQEFQIRIWVSMSRHLYSNPKDYKAIVLKMLGQLQKSSEDYPPELDQLEILKILRKKLENRSYLIVLDGVHHVEEWLENLSFDLVDKLSHGLPKRSGNGAVIVTTREEEGAKRMVGQKNIYRMERLKDEDCWTIFKNAFGDDDRYQEALNSMRIDIYSDCQGLPLVAKALGTIMRRSELATHKWD